MTSRSFLGKDIISIMYSESNKRYMLMKDLQFEKILILAILELLQFEHTLISAFDIKYQNECLKRRKALNDTQIFKIV